MTYNQLSSAIITKVTATGLFDSGSIFDYEPFEPSGFSGYPAAVVVPSSQQATYADNRRSEDHYFFDIRVHQEVPQQGAKNTEALLRQIVDTLMSSFNNDLTLGGLLTTLGYCRPVQVRWTTQRAAQPIERVCVVTLEVVVVQ